MKSLLKNQHHKNHVIALLLHAKKIRTTCEESRGETVESPSKDSHEAHSKESYEEVHFGFKSTYDEYGEVITFS